MMELMCLVSIKLSVFMEGDSSVDKSSTFQSGDPGSNPIGGLDSGHSVHEWEGMRLPAVKVILHQLAWLTGA